MGLTVTFVSGPRRSGKSVLIQTMIAQVFARRPHYLRMTAVDGDKPRPNGSCRVATEVPVASARWLEYDRERVFEIVSAALEMIHRRDKNAQVIIEADASPDLRHAYPYHHRIFVMPESAGKQEVFRTHAEAAEALKDVLDDTTAFAAEIFGLVEGDPGSDVDPHEERAVMTRTQMRGFLNTPLGDELTTRTILQPEYHGLVESDVVLINTAVGRNGARTQDCVVHVEKLLARLRARSAPSAVLYRCDPADRKAPARKQLFKQLKRLVRSSR